MKLPIGIIFATIVVAGCSKDPVETPAGNLDTLAAQYLFLELSMGLHDGAHVDAYFGPEEIRANAESAALPLAEIESRASTMATRLLNWPVDPSDAMQSARISNLVKNDWAHWIQGLH